MSGYCNRWNTPTEALGTTTSYLRPDVHRYLFIAPRRNVKIRFYYFISMHRTYSVVAPVERNYFFLDISIWTSLPRPNSEKRKNIVNTPLRPVDQSDHSPAERAQVHRCAGGRYTIRTDTKTIPDDNKLIHNTRSRIRIVNVVNASAVYPKPTLQVFGLHAHSRAARVRTREAGTRVWVRTSRACLRWLAYGLRVFMCACARAVHRIYIHRKSRSAIRRTPKRGGGGGEIRLFSRIYPSIIMYTQNVNTILCAKYTHVYIIR